VVYSAVQFIKPTTLSFVDLFMNCGWTRFTLWTSNW